MLLPNNHVLDFGPGGLDNTLISLNDANIKTAGARQNREEAQTSAIIDLDDRLGLVFGAWTTSSDVLRVSQAETHRSGVHLLEDLSSVPAYRPGGHINQHRTDADVVVLSIHWGGNWATKFPTNNNGLPTSSFGMGPSLEPEQHPVAVQATISGK